MKISELKWLYLIICFTALLACQKFEEGKWKGTIEEEEDVTVVKNPREPMYRKEVVAFEEELSIGESEGPEEYLVSTITSFTVDDEGNVIILDIRLGIKVFDKNGKYQRSIGRKGQGPGELQGPRNIQFTAHKEIMVNDMRGKGLLFFSVEGRFLSEIKNRIFMMNRHTLIDENRNIFVLGPFLGAEFFSQEKFIKMAPPYEDYEVLTSRETPRRERIIPPQIRYALLPGNNLIWGITSKYEFHIIDSQGKLIKRIEKEHTPLPMTEEYKAKYFERLPAGISKESQQFNTHFPAFDLFFPDDEGRLFVKTYEKLETSGKYSVDIFDKEGRFLARTTLKAGHEIALNQDKYLIKGGRLYASEYNEEGFPVLKRYKIIWKY